MSGGTSLSFTPHKQRVFGEMKDAIVPLGKDDHLVAGLLQHLSTPTLPADGLPGGRLALTLQPIRGRQREQQQGEHDLHLHGSCRFSGGDGPIPTAVSLP